MTIEHDNKTNDIHTIHKSASQNNNHTHEISTIFKLTIENGHETHEISIILKITIEKDYNHTNIANSVIRLVQQHTQHCTRTHQLCATWQS